MDREPGGGWGEDEDVVIERIEITEQACFNPTCSLSGDRTLKSLRCSR